MTTTFVMKKKPSLFLLALVFCVFSVTPMFANAQCGGTGGWGGWGVDEPDGVEWGGGSTGWESGGETWHPDTAAAEAFARSQVDFEQPQSPFQLISSLFAPLFAHAQCGGGSQTPTASLTATPNAIGAGESSTLTWGSENVGRCTGDFFDTGGDTSGSVLVTPEEDTTYTLTCTTGTGNLTWQYQETDMTDLSCPWTDHSRPYRGIPDCDFATPGDACSASDNRCKINSGGGGLYSCVVTTEIYACQVDGDEVTSEDTVTVGACTSTYNSEEWYTSATVVYSTGIERSNQPLDCMTTPMYDGGLEDDNIQYWNREITDYESSNGSEQYDPIGTQCWYYTTVTGTESKPPYYNEQGWDTDHFYDSGSVCTTPPVTQCSDGIDNEPDGDTDMDDNGCDGPLDDDESDELPACIDGEDNDGDELVDDADGGCDGSDTDDSELGGITATLTADDTTILIGTPATLNWECTDSTTASISTIGAVAPVAGGSVVTASISAAQASYELTCSDGTISDTDIVTISTSNPTVELTAASTRVADGGSTTLSWDGDQVSACTLTGTNGLTYSGGVDAVGVPSQKILTQTTFTVSCDGGVATDTVIVNTAVYIDEF